MRNIFGSLALWQIQFSDYSVDMRKSIPEQEMWPSDLFGLRLLRARPPTSSLGAARFACRGAEDDIPTLRISTQRPIDPINNRFDFFVLL
jgi:hypothetical protein